MPLDPDEANKSDIITRPGRNEPLTYASTVPIFIIWFTTSHHACPPVYPPACLPLFLSIPPLSLYFSCLFFPHHPQCRYLECPALVNYEGHWNLLVFLFSSLGADGGGGNLGPSA